MRSSLHSLFPCTLRTTVLWNPRLLEEDGAENPGTLPRCTNLAALLSLTEIRKSCGWHIFLLLSAITLALSFQIDGDLGLTFRKP